MSNPITKAPDFNSSPKVDSESHPAIYYADTGLQGEQITPELIIRDIDAFKVVAKAVEKSRGTKNGVADNMRQRIGITDITRQRIDDQNSFVTEPTDSDWSTGSEADWQKHWSKGDYNPKVYRGEMARQIRLAIGEAAAMQSFEDSTALPAQIDNLNKALAWNKKPTGVTEELERILQDASISTADRDIEAVDERVSHKL